MLPGRGGGQHHLAIEDRRQAGDDQVDVGRLDDATPVLLHALIAEPIRQTVASVPLTSVTRPAAHEAAPGYRATLEGAALCTPAMVPAPTMATRTTGRLVHVSCLLAPTAGISSTRMRRPSRAEVRMASHSTAAW